jgi:Flp pilus assembly protein TadB
LTKRETGYWPSRRKRSKGDAVGLLWLLVVLLIIFALVGGLAINNWLFVILLIALILLLVGYV